MALKLEIRQGCWIRHCEINRLYYINKFMKQVGSILWHVCNLIEFKLISISIIVMCCGLDALLPFFLPEAKFAAILGVPVFSTEFICDDAPQRPAHDIYISD